MKKEEKQGCRFGRLPLLERIFVSNKYKKDYSKYYLHFQLKGLGIEWLDAGLPVPNYFYRFSSIDGKSNFYGICYLVDGFFATKRNQEYLNDVIARFIYTLPVRQRLMYPPKPQHKQIDTIYHLKDFQALKSLKKEFVPKLRGYISSRHDDEKFWELKLYLEYQIQNSGGEGNMVSFEIFQNHAWNFYDWKDFSSCRSKCRNIWDWYSNRGWKYHILKKQEKKSKKEIEMTRRERALANAKMINERSRKAIINLITGLYADEYKKKNGKWHIGKIAKALKMSRDTVSKHIKAWEQKEA